MTTSSKRIVALIGAKGESGRLRNKNWRDFLGKPMFQWNLEKALKYFSEVYVSSDHPFILKRSEELGAISIARPKELCGETPNISFYQHAQQTMDADIIVAIQANSPTLNEEVIRLVINLMKEGKNEVKTAHPHERRDYGSIWAMTRDRLMNYKDPYHAQPDVWVMDESIDIHTIEDMRDALSSLNFGKNFNTWIKT